MQKAIIGRPHNIPEKVFLKMAEMSQENNCPPYHSTTDHIFWHKRYPRNKYACPYCNLGSKLIYDSLVAKPQILKKAYQPNLHNK